MVIPAEQLFDKTIVNKPIKFVGTGEKMDAIDVFYPIMAERI
jgi:signal recognition particle subunit SRP54